MTLYYKALGELRKKLVRSISEILECEAKYLGAPTFAYQVGDIIVDRNGSVSFENENVTEEIKEMVDDLEERGFVAEGAEIATQPPVTGNEELSEPSENEPHSESVGLTVEVPLESVAVGNLTKLLDCKGNLIKKALGATNLSIEVTESTVKFPWFEEIEPESVTAYTHFITALCEFTKNQTRINTTAKETENEKYAFRCFLLRLGFIGAEYKTDRKILSQNLTGSSAFKSGHAKAVTE